MHIKFPFSVIFTVVTFTGAGRLDCRVRCRDTIEELAKLQTAHRTRIPCVAAPLLDKPKQNRRRI